MKLRDSLIGFVAAAAGMMTSAKAQEILAQEPPAGALKRGEIVLVDDKSCPKGEIKEITGGRNLSGQPTGLRRQKRCIRHPGK